MFGTSSKYGYSVMFSKRGNRAKVQMSPGRSGLSTGWCSWLPVTKHGCPAAARKTHAGMLAISQGGRTAYQTPSREVTHVREALRIAGRCLFRDVSADGVLGIASGIWHLAWVESRTFCTFGPSDPAVEHVSHMSTKYRVYRRSVLCIFGGW